MPQPGDIDIEAWLTTIGLADYAAAFRDSDIDAAVLPHLTAEDLREIGIASVGHRRRILAAAAALADRPAPEPSAERRVLSILFCDIVGSTAISVASDPEDYADFITRFRQSFEAAIRPFGGHVTQFLGDGAMASFGYPAATEHDAERAVAAGLAIIDQVARIDPMLGRPVAVRIGIATGLTVVGSHDIASALRDDSALGEIPNLAARLQAAAEPNNLVISERTRALIGEVFDCADFGGVALKGITGKVRIWQVLGRSSSASRFDALRTGRLATGFVGRQAELAALAQALAEDGPGRVVLVTGDAGIGKSRLVRQALMQRGLEPASALILQCSPYHQGAPFQPIRYFLTRACGIGAKDAPELLQARIAAFLGQIGLASPENLGLTARLLEAEPADAAAIEALSAGEMRARLMRLLQAVLLARARTAGFLVLEDAHWIDPSTAELMTRLVPDLQARGGRFVATARIGDPIPWLERFETRTIPLDRLSATEVSALVATIAGGQQLPDKVAETIAARSDGVPIFAEELIRGYLEAASDAGSDALAQVPMSLAESIQARLDRLTHGRRIASIAAAIGREMPVTILAEVADLPPEALRSGLADLMRAEVLDPSSGEFGEAIRFRHHLVRDAAYQLLLRRQRTALHARIADVLDTRFPELVRDLPHVLAIQRTEARQFRRASAAWDRAGQGASRRSAYAEAAGFFRRALDALAQTAAGRERDEAELELRLHLVSALICAQGYRADAVAEETERVVALGQGLGSTARLIAAMQARWVQLASANNVRAACAFALQVREMTARGPEIDRLIAHRMCGTSQLFAGALEPALAEYDAFQRLFDPERHAEALRGGHSDHSTMVMLGLAETHLLMGAPALADGWRYRALEASRAAGRLHDQGHTLVFAGCLHSHLLERPDETAAHAAALGALIAAHALPNWTGFRDLFDGLLRAGGGDPAGLAAARRGIDGLFAARAFGNWWQLLYAEACIEAGRWDEAEAMLARAGPMIDLGAAQFAAEFLRLRARIALRRDHDPRAAGAALRAALSLAETQRAVLFSARIRRDAAASGLEQALAAAPRRPAGGATRPAPRARPRLRLS